MKKILLTGADGFIGRHTIPFLINKGYEVHAVFCSVKQDVMEDKNLFWHQCNLLDLIEQKRLISEIKPTHLLHFAWDTTYGKYWTSSENFNWLEASLGLLINFIENGGKRAVFAGTCAEYHWNYEYYSEELTPKQPATTYGACKHSLHEKVRQLCQQAGISYTWGRIFFLYGPYEHPSRLIPYVICSLLQDKPALCRHGDKIRDFLYVQDVASAFVSLLDSNVTGPVNVASGKPIALKDIVNKIADKLNKPDLVRFAEDADLLNEPKLLVAKVERLNNEVGWMSSYDLNRGLDETINWWKNQKKRFLEKSKNTEISD